MTWDADGWHDIESDLLESWRLAYPKLDIEAELRKMNAWILANPRKRKKNWARFATNWLARARPEPRKAETFGLITGQMPDCIVFE